MVESDRKQFAALIVSLAEVFDGGKEPSQMKMQLYWQALKDYTIEQVQKAASDIIRERVYPSLPKPAEIIEAIRGKQGDRATEAWIEVIAAIRRVGTWESVQFADPVIHAVIEHLGGWPKLCEMQTDEEKWKQKEFEKLYPIMEKRGGCPEYLPGQFEIQNHSDGYEYTKEPVKIGFSGEDVKEIEHMEGVDRAGKARAQGGG